MRIGQFNRRTPRNGIRGGKRSADTEFNIAFKKERHPNPPQYAGKKVKEFNRFPEMKDLRAQQSGKERGQTFSEQRLKRQRSKGRTQDLARKFARQIVYLAVGSVIVTSSYQSMVEARKSEKNRLPDQNVIVSGDTDPADVGMDQNNTEQTGKDGQIGAQDGDQSNTQGEGGNGDSGSNGTNGSSGIAEGNGAESSNGSDNSSGNSEAADSGIDEDNSNRGDSDNDNSDDSTGDSNGEPVWTWESDNSSATVQISGVGSATATITSTEDPALCTTEGTITFTATAELDGKTYTDTRTETIPATGHTFGAAQTTTNSDGTITMTYHCSACNQDFTITFGITEE